MSIYELLLAGQEDNSQCAGQTKSMDDPVDHPVHYTNHPSGIECIRITEHMNFCLGNAMKYIWRAGQKGSVIEDLGKAIWYISAEIERLKKVSHES